MASGSAEHKLPFQFPSGTESVQRFSIDVDQDLIDFAKERARTYRGSSGLSTQWTLEGPPKDTVSELASYWANKYDWKTVQTQINSEFEHFATTVPGNGDYKPDIPIHFVHRQSSNKEATPLLLLHGWPSSHLLWSKIIEPLSKTHHLVVPDLPGYGFSPAPSAPGLGPPIMGKAFDTLMKRLGYQKYGLVSTDLGFLVAMFMVIDVSESIVAHFTDFLLLNPTPEDQERMARKETTQEEDEYITAMNIWNTAHFAYASMHATKPLLLSHSFADSPVGHAAWIWDLKHASSDGYQYSLDHIITTSLMMWIQEPYTSLRAYSEALKPEIIGGLKKSAVPSGVVQFGNKNGPFPALAKYILAPESWTGRLVNAIYFKRHEFGGHFAALTHPEVYVEHILDFFSLVESAGYSNIESE